MRPSAMHAREGGGERVLEAGSPSWGVVVVISIMILPYILDVFGLHCLTTLCVPYRMPLPFPPPTLQGLSIGLKRHRFLLQ
jgi:hypothetical protein